MTANDAIANITHLPYRRIGDALPDDVDGNVVSAVFERIVVESLNTAMPVERPFLLNVAGIPGAGKSTYCKNLLAGKSSFCGLDFSNSLYLAFDEIMCNPQSPYRAEAALDAARAFDRWEIPARIAGYELLKRAVDGKLNILLEHSSSVVGHATLFELLASRYDYELYFGYLNVNLDEAKKRVEKRARRENRSFAPERIDERYVALGELLPEYRKLFKSNFKQKEQWELYSQ